MKSRRSPALTNTGDTQMTKLTATETLSALEHAAQLLDVARVVFRDAGNHEAANLLSAASKRAWAAILKARTE